MTRARLKLPIVPAVAGLKPEEVASLRLILGLKPWQSRGVGAEVGRFLDGVPGALSKAPTLRAKVSKAARTLRKAARS